ncbi:fibronectin type III domain-containing protein [Ruminococcus albus]|uniref:Fibronectin type III domain protein n=1 Tax=Ruminococcus albus (strain ATCC 27210 / DSM 20455 / JCM 14654 / NCDO 2250 / 7) TaxID=697329 RepID=E6UB85_RUMA7|nr:fibronectin type III domain-containing protein [Ruminococcus albus]ADU21435.1 Fibronectin type III domain protein [Ruminococcus albus 7 = DSM 20455]
MTENITWKRVTAGLMALVLAAGAVPTGLGGAFKDRIAVVASAEAETDTVKDTVKEETKEETEIWKGKGKGTKTAPYLISSADEWKQLAVLVNKGESFSGKYFKLTKDITVTEMIGKNEHPNETVSRPFSGIFDGNGRTLTVKIDESEKDDKTHGAAPFCGVKDAVIKNLVVKSSIYSGIHSAGLVGVSLGTLEINNVLVEADISGDTHNGGLVGHSFNTVMKITNCGFTGRVKASDVACALVGWCGPDANITVSNCLINGTIADAGTVNNIAEGMGGVVTIKNVYSTLEDKGNNSMTVKGSVTPVSEIKAPEAVEEELVYDGEEHELITEGSVKGAKMVYSLTVDGKYTTDIPKVTNAGEYKVWYKLEGMGNCTAKFVKVNVAKADIEPSVSVANWAYGDEASVPAVEGNTGEGEVTFEYKVKGADDETYTDKVPTEVGEYTVKATVAETENYNGDEAFADFAVEIKYTRHEAKPSSCNTIGNTEYYEGSDGKYYVLENTLYGGYKEIEKDSWIIPATHHHYEGAPEWKWTDDYSTATAEFNCVNGDATEKVKAEVTSDVKKPTCTEKGKAVYTAKVTFEGEEYTDTKTEVLEATGHSYGEPVWTWDKNNASVKIVCSECGDELSADAKITVKVINPTFEADGEIVYTAAATIDGKEYTDKKVVYTSKLSSDTTLSYVPGNGSVSLSWTAVDNAEKYAVCSFVGGKWRKFAEVEGTSYEVKGLKKGVNYKTAVLVYANGKWSSDFSNAIGVTPKSDFPVADVEVSGKRFKLSWSTVEGADRYGIGIYKDGEWELLAREDGDVNSVISPEFEDGTYRIAVFARVNGEWDMRNIDSRAFDVTIE